MFIEEILRLSNNTSITGTFLISDIKLKPFVGKNGHFLTFSLQDKTGLIWAKLWDEAERILQALKDISIVTIIGTTNIYNNKTQIVVEKIKKADDYDIKDLIKVSSSCPEQMWTELSVLLDTNLNNNDCKIIWEKFKTLDFIEKFKLWPGGKGIVHHAYQHGLLEHTLSIIKFIVFFNQQFDLPLDLDKSLIGGLLHDIGKIDAYDFNVKITMSNIGRLHEHTVLGYYKFRKIIEDLNIANSIIEDVGHIILSHHGSNQYSVIKPMTIEAKIVATADYLDSDTNYMMNQIEHNKDEQGWIFDTLNSQFYFKRPTLKRRKNVKY